MRIGFNLPQMGPLAHQARDAAQYAREAEALGADSLWVYDRLLAPVNLAKDHDHALEIMNRLLELARGR